MMEAWPTLARVLLMTSIADWLKTVQSRDFSMTDIILLHPSNVIFASGKAKQLLTGSQFKQIGNIKIYYMSYENGKQCFVQLECGREATPHPGGFKCFTCEDAADNYECNRWAPDVYCPKDARYCHTLHMMDNHGDSVSVTKRCVTLEDCLFTGCAAVTDNGYQMCSSCCEGNICNVLVPRNASSAVFSSTSPLVSSSGGFHPAALSHIIIIIGIFTAGHVCISNPT